MALTEQQKADLKLIEQAIKRAAALETQRQKSLNSYIQQVASAQAKGEPIPPVPESPVTALATRILLEPEKVVESEKAAAIVDYQKQIVQAESLKAVAESKLVELGAEVEAVKK